MAELTVVIPERTDPRLGRVVVHDPRSRGFALPSVTTYPTQAVQHTRHVPIFDQGQIGSCTANAALGCLMTAPHWRWGWSFTEADALRLYEQETWLDDRDIPGHYPPADTGSSGLWSAKALMARNLISGYRHAFDAKAALTALTATPLTVGCNWYGSMMKPKSDGLVSITTRAKVVGGHQVELVGVDPKAKTVRFANSWGESWGDNGYGVMSWATFERLLSEDGDAIALVA